jgi:hypothetical protein
MASDGEKLVPKLVLELEGDRAEFLAHGTPNQWALMQNAQAVKDNDPRASAASTYQLTISSVLPEERSRFNAWMMAHGQATDLEDKLTDALVALWDGKTLLPLEPTSSDLSSSTGENGSTSTAGSSEPESSPEGIRRLILAGENPIHEDTSSIPA